MCHILFVLEKTKQPDANVQNGRMTILNYNTYASVREQGVPMFELDDYI